MKSTQTHSNDDKECNSTTFVDDTISKENNVKGGNITEGESQL